MKDWERIRREREDITDYVIHFIRPKYGNEPQKPIDILKRIIKDGYLIPTYAIRSSIYDRSNRPTIKGPYPALCLTEQSIANFVKSCKILSTRYSPYGVAFSKKAFFQYGGRPVIYHSEEILGDLVIPGESDYEEGREIYRNGLSKDYQYLWARYQPIPNMDGYVVDWTHEREWRCRVREYHDAEIGLTPKEGVPILLPSVYDYSIKKWVHYLPKIIVPRKSEKEEISRTIIESAKDWYEECEHNYLRRYYEVLPKVKVITIEDIEKSSEITELDWEIL